MVRIEIREKESSTGNLIETKELDANAALQELIKLLHLSKNESYITFLDEECAWLEVRYKEKDGSVRFAEFQARDNFDTSRSLTTIASWYALATGRCDEKEKDNLKAMMESCYSKSDAEM